MANIRDVARAAGVGIGTVSRALNDSGYVEAGKKEKIRRIAKELNYRPSELSRSFVQKKSGLVGIVLPDVAFPFYGAFLKYAELELNHIGYKTLVCNTLGVQKRVSDTLDLIEAGSLDGMIINTDVTREEIERMKGMPVVSFERVLAKEIPMVASDHMKGGQIAAKLLKENGCKNVMILGARFATKVHAENRIKECRRILEQSGIQVTAVEINGAFLSYPFIEEMISQYLDMYSRIDGIFTEDVEAYCCLMQAKKRGIYVPRDLKIVGYDGNEMTRMIDPQVTTIAQDVPLLARTCVEVLAKKIAKEKVDAHYYIPVKLVQGGTTV